MQFNPNLINVNTPTKNSYSGLQKNGQAAEVLSDNMKRGVGQATGVSTSGLKLGEKKSAEDVANTMLSHVQRGLDQLRARGADESRIQQRLEAAKEGIAKGYEQAEQQLKDMGLLNDDLKADIDKGRDLIEAGLYEMEFGKQPTSGDNKVDAFMPSSSSESRYSSQVGQKNSMTLELMTKDGDKISLSFMQSAQSASYSSGSNSGNNTQQLNVSGFEQNTSWQMDVVGSLDEGEQDALSNLLKDVEKLSSTFFDGDLGGALEQAMSLGFDGNELASMSLNLRQESFSSVSRAYNSVQPKLPTADLENLSSSLLSYNDDYLSALEQAKSFANPEKLINDLVDQLYPDGHLKDIFQAYNQGLQDAVENRAKLLSGDE